jgi:hypothetical protein
MTQHRDDILLHGGEAARIVWSDSDVEGAIYASDKWFVVSTTAEKAAAKAAACQRAGRSDMVWQFVARRP